MGAPSSKKFRFPGSSQNPLSKLQKAGICIVARKAWDAKQPGARFSDWRRDQQLMAVRKASLTDCVQDDYLPLLAHFEGLAGNGKAQFQAAYRHEDESPRQARFLLEKALAERGLDVGYAEKICRDQYKKPLERATAKQLFGLKFRVEQRRKKIQQEVAEEAEFYSNPF